MAGSEWAKRITVEAQVKAVMKANPSLVYHGMAPYFTLNEMRSLWWVLSRVYILL